MASYILVGAYTLDPERTTWIQSNCSYAVPVLKDDFLTGKADDVKNVVLVKSNETSEFFDVAGCERWTRSRLANLNFPGLVLSTAKEFYVFHLVKASKTDITISSKKRNCLINLAEFIKDDMDKAVLTHALHEKKSDRSTVYAESLQKITSKEIQSVIAAQPESISVNLRQMDLFDEVPFPPPQKPRFKFIDLFAGIGGFRIAMQNCGGKCVFTSEFDAAAQKTYQANFGEFPFGDITKQETHDKIPSDFDVVCAGFPCQAFSLAGKRMGFNDNYKGMSRGTLFQEVIKICERHRPKAVFCENVKGLYIHDKGNTFKVIKGEFEAIGYKFFSKILNSKDFGVPQHRERVYMVAFREDYVPDGFEFEFPEPTGERVTLNDIREHDVPAKYYLSEVYLETLRRHRARHEAAGHGFGYIVRDWDDISGAIVCGGMGRETNLLREENGTPAGLAPETHIKGRINQEGIRKMTPREWARLQGFPEEYRLVLSDVHLYKQFGNSVSIPVIQAISQRITDVVCN